MKRWFSFFVVVMAFLLSPPLHSKDEKKEKAAKEETEIPEVLDVYERKAEMYRFEFSPYAGDLIGDKLHHSFVFGGGLDYRITPRFSIGTDFFWTDISFDPASALGRSITNQDMYSIQGVVTLNAPAAFLSKKKVVETDFFTTIGGGILRINGQTRGDGFVGGGIKIYTGLARWFGFRVEVRNYFWSIPTATGSKFSTDLVMTFGPTFLLPPKMF